jgi:hypothetical protein
MAHRNWPENGILAVWVRRSVLAAALAIFAFPAFVTTGHTPGPDDRGDVGTFVTASLQRSGDHVVLTGSVDHLFANSVFTGPTSEIKQDRARPREDLLAIARSFTEMRIQLASLHDAPPDPTDAPMSRLAAIEPQNPLEDAGPRISVAAIDPAFVSALSAIEDADQALDSSIPFPLSVPESLAYARANTPSTASRPNPYNDRELYCLATAIYFEARGESYRGQVAVAQVVMNRVEHSLYPNSICGVVYQNQSWRNRCQFSFACDGRPERITERGPWATAQEIADKVTRDQLYLSEVASATHYHANYVYPHWAPRMTRMTRVGLHIFYKFRGS